MLGLELGKEKLKLNAISDSTSCKNEMVLFSVQTGELRKTVKAISGAD